MRTIFCALCLFAVTAGCCFADEFIPPPEKDPPVLNAAVNSEDLVPLGVASIGIAAAGLIVTTLGFYNIYCNIENGFDSPGLQAGIIMTAGGGILTAVAAILIDFIFDETDSFTMIISPE